LGKPRASGGQERKRCWGELDEGCSLSLPPRRADRHPGAGPHIAGGGSSGYPQQKALFGENLARLAAGAPLRNVCRIPPAA
jgi:hypothetical protein